MAIVENFIIHAGDDIELAYTVDAPEGVTLEGAMIRWRAAKTVNSHPKIEKVSGGGGINITDSEARTFEIVVSGAETENLRGAYYHEAEVTDTAGNVTTITTGTMTVKPTLIR